MFLTRASFLALGAALTLSAAPAAQADTSIRWNLASSTSYCGNGATIRIQIGDRDRRDCRETHRRIHDHRRAIHHHRHAHHRQHHGHHDRRAHQCTRACPTHCPHRAGHNPHRRHAETCRFTPGASLSLEV